MNSAAHYWTFLFHATPPRSQRTDYHGQSVSIVANFAALRETKMSSSVVFAFEARDVFFLVRLIS
jgi:hypothetical protein